MDSTAPIALDYTLRDLYSLDNDAGSQITLIYNPSHLRSRGTSSSAKFTYQYMLHTGHGKDPGSPLASKIVPQRFGFFSRKDARYPSRFRFFIRRPKPRQGACSPC